AARHLGRRADGCARLRERGADHGSAARTQRRRPHADPHHARRGSGQSGKPARAHARRKDRERRFHEPRHRRPMLIVALLSLPFLYIVLRRPVLRRLALRNAARRPRETALVILGALLGTAIMTGSFVVGDTFSSSI